MERLPEIRVIPTEDPKMHFIGPHSPEPEVEECCEDNEVKQILENLGLEYEKISKLKALTHVPPSVSCLHCKLMGKVKSLQSGIQKLSGDIETTEEILKAKQVQNKDIKNIIQRLEGSIGTTENSLGDDEGEKRACSCVQNCCII